MEKEKRQLGPGNRDWRLIDFLSKKQRDEHMHVSGTAAEWIPDLGAEPVRYWVESCGADARSCRVQQALEQAKKPWMARWLATLVPATGESIMVM